MPEPPLRVLVADDHAIVREGVRSVLESAPGFAIVGEATRAADVAALVGEHRPDVVLLDVSFPDGSGLDVAARIASDPSNTRVLMLSVYDDPEYVLQAVRAGALGYVLKESSPDVLRDAVRAVHRGESYFGPRVAGQLGTALRDEAARDDSDERLERLTARERDVLTLIASGRTNKEAAAKLGISPRTVESHRERVMKKLGARTAADLARFALRTGVITE